MSGTTFETPSEISKRSKSNHHKNPVSKAQVSSEMIDKYMPKINMPVESLPSKALPYRDIIIQYRPYIMGEIQQVSDSKLSTKQGFELMLNGIECNIDKYDLTMADFLYVCLLRKISTLGSRKFTVPFYCDVCGHNGQFPFTTEEIEFQDIEAPSLPVTLEIRGEDFSFMPLTIRKFYKLLDMGKEEDQISILASQVINKPFEESYKTLFHTTFQEVEDLKEVDKLLFHGVKPVERECGHKACSNVVKVELDGGQALLLPFREQGMDSRTRIRFGASSKG